MSTIGKIAHEIRDEIHQKVEIFGMSMLRYDVGCDDEWVIEISFLNKRSVMIFIDENEISIRWSLFESSVVWRSPLSDPTLFDNFYTFLQETAELNNANYRKNN